MKRVLVALCVSLLVASCTKSGDIYDSSKHTKEDFSAGNTALGVLGAGLIVACIAMAEDCADGLGSGGSTTDTDWDWDYLPGSGEWERRDDFEDVTLTALPISATAAGMGSEVVALGFPLGIVKTFTKYK